MIKYSPWAAPNFGSLHRGRRSRRVPRPWTVNACFGLAAAIRLYCFYMIVFIGSSLNIDEDSRIIKFYEIAGIAMMAVAAIAAVLLLIVPLMANRDWAWFVGLFSIGLGLVVCCSWPFTIPMMAFWFLPSTRRFFSRGD